MYRQIPSLIAVAAATVLLLGACATAGEPAPSTADTVAAPHWTYTEHDGAEGWGELATDFATCATGTQQSPIDLPSALPAASTVLEVTTEVAEATEADSGHASQVTVEDDGSEIVYGGQHYELLQVHAHTPAEHTVDGVAPAVEFHLVHSTEDGELLVLGVLANVGEANASWQTFLDTATGSDGTTVDLDVATLLPSELTHWSYSGSLTTPPCSENVQWIVFTTPVEVSAEQVATLHDVHGDNSRPTQPLGDRTIGSGTGTLAVQGE